MKNIPPIDPPGLASCGPLQRAMNRWYGFLAARRLILILVLVAISIAMSLASRGIRWQTNVLLFFSARSRTVHDLTNTRQYPALINAMRMDVHFARNHRGNAAQAAGTLQKSLLATGQFQSVFSGFTPEAGLNAQLNLMSIAPVILDRSALQTFRHHLAAAWLNRHFAAVAADLAAPDGQLQAAQLAADPLGLSAILSSQLRRLNPAPAAHMENGMIVSADRRHVMLILLPKVPAQNIVASSQMLAAVHKVVAREQSRMPGLRVWLIGPARNYVENARRVKADVTLVSIVGTVLVAIAILLFFRRISTLLICMIPPVMGVGTALGIAGLLHLRLPLLVLAFAGLICGSTTDYGIQFLAALNRASREDGKFLPTHSGAAARAMLGPISLSVITSVTGYSAIMFSSAPGLRGLGLFVAAATVCIWCVTFLILPAFFGPWVLAKASVRNNARWAFPAGAGRWLRRSSAVAFVLLTGVLLFHAAHVAYNRHGRSLDGVGAALRRQEHEFFQTWGNLRHRAVVIVSNRHADKAMAALHRLDQALTEFRKDGLISSFQSPGFLLPDSTIVGRRLTRWRNFWTPARQLAVEKRLATAAAANGFRPAAFSNRVAAIAKLPEIPGPLERLRESPARLIPGPVDLQTSAGRTTRINLAAEVQLNSGLSPRMRTDWAGELRLRQPGAAILSGDLLFYNATARAQAEAENLFPWVALLILLPMLLFFRRIDLTCVSAISMLVGFIWLLGAAQWFAGGLNLLSLVPLLFMMGVAVDYGIYSASDPAWRNPMAAGGNRNAATFLCALTTFLGTAAMLVAGHPALRGIGLTLAAGIAGGYLASYFLVSPMTRLIFRLRTHRLDRVVFFLIAGFWRLAGLLMLLALAALIAAQVIMFHEKPAHLGPIPHWPVVQTGAQAWTCGPARIRRDHGVWDMHIGGTSEQIGYEASALGAPMDLRIENQMLDRMDALAPNLFVRWFLLRAIGMDMLFLPQYIPADIKRELYAEAQAHPDEHGYLMPLYPRLLAYHALDDISQNLVDNPLIDRHAVGCTGVVATPAWSGDGHLWLGRNFDFECGPAFNHQKSITFVKPRHGYAFATVAWPGLAGCVSGMNEKHIGLFINAAASASFRPVGEPTIIVARQVLQHAASIHQAIEIFRAAHVFVSNIIVVGNGRNGRAAVLEISPAHFAWRYIHGFTAVANQLECPVFAQDPVNLARIKNSTSNWRLRRATRLIRGLKGHVNEFSMAALLRDNRGPHGRNIGWGNRNSIDGLITTHSVIMDLTAGNIWVAAFPFAEGNYVGFRAMPALRGPTTVVGAGPPLPIIPADHFLTSGHEKLFLRSRAHLVAGYAALAAGRFAQAAALATMAIHENPFFFGGYSLRGRAELAQRKYAAAAADLAHALRLDPPYAARRASLRKALAAAGRNARNGAK